ncbi:MAG: Gfo/Idh/MocA family oxidoreductase [Candidatus Omnitrophica bacterium]|nr:Gfo/Idh/MocA family oxidoreductase [Candidatus Omnitrophota bacterium]
MSALPSFGKPGANDKISLGFIGVGGRGAYHLKEFSEMDDVRVVAVADVAQDKLDRIRAAFPAVQTFKDFRRVLELKDVDAVVVAPPDHWHAIPTMLACQAGKDVYVEKPLGHNIREGRAMIKAARKYNRRSEERRVHRSGPHWIEAVDMIKSGQLGKISLIRAWNCWDLKNMGADLGNPPDSDPPPGLDYDMWLGPAPKRPFNPRRYDFYFYFFWDYSGGMISAWGVHLLDVITWAMGPTVKSVTTIGGRFILNDMRETPDTTGLLYECPNYVLTYEVRHGNGNPPWGGFDHGIEFYGTDASIWINRNGYTLFPENDRAHPKQVPSQGMDLQHKRNFLDCVRSRRRPNADVELGHLGTIPSHLGNIAYRCGGRIIWDGEHETIPDNPQAEALLGRTYREPWVLPEV